MMSKIDPAITAALITGVIGPLTTLLVTRFHDRRQFNTLPRARQDALNGRWPGTATQHFADQGETKHPVTAEIHAGRKLVTAKTRITYAHDATHAHVEFAMKGGFLH